MNLNEDVRGGTFCLSKAGLGIGSTASGVKIAAPAGSGINYTINGICYYKVSTATIAITAAAAQAADTTCLYLVCLNAAGTLSTVKGTEVDTDEFIAGNAPLEWPHPVADTCPIGAIKVATTAAFVAGTTLLSADAVTDTYYDLLTVPVAPLTHS